MADSTTTSPDLVPFVDATAAALAAAQNLRAKLTGLETARPAFVANNSLADLKAYDQSIADTRLAVEQADARLRLAQVAEMEALYRDDQQRKTLYFASASLTNSTFWLKFGSAYDEAATRLMAVIEAGEVMCRTIAGVNADNRPDGADPLRYAGTVLEWIRDKLVIPTNDGARYCFQFRQRTVAYADGTDPVADFLQEVTAAAASAVSAAGASAGAQPSS